MVICYLSYFWQIVSKFFILFASVLPHWQIEREVIFLHSMFFFFPPFTTAICSFLFRREHSPVLLKEELIEKVETDHYVIDSLLKIKFLP